MFKLDDPLSRRREILLCVVGALLLLAGVALAFLALAIAGGGHTWPFSGSSEDAMFAAALLSVPATMIAMGLTLVRPNAARAQIAARIALLIPVEAAIVAAAIWQLNRPEPSVSIPAADPHAVITGVVVLPPAPAPQPVAVGCAVRGGCPQPATITAPARPSR